MRPRNTPMIYAPQVDWLDEDIRRQTDNGQYPDIITPDFGVGITFKDNKGKEYTTVSGKEKRRIDIDVHTFKGGYCWEAAHYYAHIEVGEPNLEYIEDEKTVRGYIGGAFDQYKPKGVGVENIRINIVRLITPEELKGNDDKDHRWFGYHEGSTTNAYEDEIQLYNDAVSCVKARFAGDWVVWISGFDNEELNTDNEGQGEIPLAEFVAK